MWFIMGLLNNTPFNLKSVNRRKFLGAKFVNEISVDVKRLKALALIKNK